MVWRGGQQQSELLGATGGKREKCWDRTGWWPLSMARLGEVASGATFGVDGPSQSEGGFEPCEVSVEIRALSFLDGDA